MSEVTHQDESIQTQTHESNITAEMNRLGENIGKLLKVAWESEERKSIEREIRSGLDQLTKQIDDAAEQARIDRTVKKARDGVKGVWETAHGPRIVNEMRLGLVDSLKKINDELSRLAEPKPAYEVKDQESPPRSTE